MQKVEQQLVQLLVCLICGDSGRVCGRLCSTARDVVPTAKMHDMLKFIQMLPIQRIRCKVVEGSFAHFAVQK